MIIRIMARVKDVDSSIGYEEWEPWFSDFWKKMKKVKKATEERSEAEASSLIEERRKNEAELLDRMETLMDDPEFRKRKTHRAMLIYAIEKIPGLSRLRESKIKHKIALIADQMEHVKRH